MKRLKNWLQGDSATAGVDSTGRPAQPLADVANGLATSNLATNHLAIPCEPPVRVLMVCMGNICRSPTAEGVLRAKLQQAGLQGRVVVDSAGTHGYHAGEPPDPRAIRHAAQRGYDITSQRARAVTQDDFARFDWILVMDQANLDSLAKRKPAASAVRLELVLGHGAGFATTRDVPDPYYGSGAGFDRVLDLLEDACDGFVAKLVATTSARAG